MKIQVEGQLFAVGQRNGNRDKVSIDLPRLSTKEIVAELVKEKGGVLLHGRIKAWPVNRHINLV